MSHFRTLAPMLGLNCQRSALMPAAMERAAGLTALAATLLSATLFSAAPAHAQTTYTVTDLNPASGGATTALAISGDKQVGYVSSGDISHALLWRGTAASVLNLNPAGFKSSFATGVNGTAQVGYGYLTSDANDTHALLWHDSAGRFVDLTPPGFTMTQASGVFGNTQVGQGYGTATGGTDAHALLWTGKAASVVDLNPEGFTLSQANGVSSDTQVGSASFPDTGNGGYIIHALLWHGTAGSAVDLHPAGYEFSTANGVDGDTQVGSAVAGDFDEQARYAFLWHGTADSAVNLTPGNEIDGNDFAEALAVSGNVQVGDGDITGLKHALVWHGTAASQVDLNDFLPAGFNFESFATGVNASGDIVGYGFGGAGTHAFLWHPASAGALAITSLDPASRTQGREDFTLTVIGTGFTAASQVQWNGVSQSTTFVSATKLTAPISQFLIAQAGTARITVLTSNTALSNTRLETIMPRPAITGLSPKSKPAGAAAFTLTVNGTGFRPAGDYAPSVVKWNGMELATTFVSAMQLTATVPASLLTKSGTAAVTVTTPQVATSAGKAFTVTP